MPDVAWAVPAGELAGVFAALVMIIGASAGIFWLLVRRWTTQRHWVALGDWADENRFALRGGELVGENLVLDFSARPFDPLELERVDGLAEQIVLHLP